MMVDFQETQNDITKMLKAIPPHDDFALITAVLTLCSVLNHGLHGIAEAIELHRDGFGSST